jgi:uncharacterized protein YeaO (DUF488 family)/DNA-binding MarR family transcriptional regulator
MAIDKSDYSKLLRIRTEIRSFLKWSESQAKLVGLTPAQHQLLLAIKGHEGDQHPTVSDLTDYLLIKNNSCVELVDRAVKANLIKKKRDNKDFRNIRVSLTKLGESKIERLSNLHIEELKRLTENINSVTLTFLNKDSSHFDGETNNVSQIAGNPKFILTSVYSHNPPHRSQCYLIDRLWPRGITKLDKPFEFWFKNVTPSNDLRKFYSHNPDRFDEFSIRYKEELDETLPNSEIRQLISAANHGAVYLMTATKDLSLSHGNILISYLTEILDQPN